MKLNSNSQKIFKEIEKNLNIFFPGKIEKIILYGSRSREDFTEFSDYDFLLITKENFDWKYENKILDSIYDLELEYDIIADIRMISRNDLQTIKGKQPFILNAFKEGISF
jgi:predicted nucleotidyltransferase